MLELISLFASSFIAATLLPMGSEVALYVLLQRGFDPALLLLVATTGNTAGSAVNWLLGKYLQTLKSRRWFYFTEQQIERAQHHFQKYGQYSLLLAWLPVVGDLLTLAAGIFRVRLVPFLLLVATGKMLRYLVVIYLA